MILRKTIARSSGNAVRALVGCLAAAIVMLTGCVSSLRKDFAARLIFLPDGDERRVPSFNLYERLVSNDLSANERVWLREALGSEGYVAWIAVNAVLMAIQDETCGAQVEKEFGPILVRGALRIGGRFSDEESRERLWVSADARVVDPRFAVYLDGWDRYVPRFQGEMLDGWRIKDIRCMFDGRVVYTHAEPMRLVAAYALVDPEKPGAVRDDLAEHVRVIEAVVVGPWGLEVPVREESSFILTSTLERAFRMPDQDKPDSANK